ncbi:MAG: hypothetical protein KDA86_02470 [Planctomycetaceae bacterium]|nr:hypothetical protein [Planctomycetaceae bacterium]
MNLAEIQSPSHARSHWPGKSWTGVINRKVRRKWHYAMIIVLATTLNFARLMQAEPLNSANDRSRWCTVWSLVERGTYQIDEIRQRSGWDTIDLVKHDDHFYSTKPPLFPTIVAGLYWSLKHTLGWSLDHHLLTTTRILLTLINIVPLTIALWLLSRVIDRVATNDFTRYFLVVTAATATLLQPFVIVLNNHLPGAICCMFALYAVIQILIEEHHSPKYFAMAGFFAACTCCNELPAAAFGASLFFFLARADLRKTFIWFVPAALVPLIAFFVTNIIATGGWKPFYLYYGTEKYLFIDDGVPSYWWTPQGIDQAKDSLWIYLLHCTVGHHGLLSLTPLYVLTLVGWVRTCQGKTPVLHLIHLWGLGLTLLVFGFFLTKTENYNYGGVSVALRWMLWLTPFWILAMIPTLDRWQPGRAGSLACLVLFACSVFSAWYPFDSPWKQPWLFEWMTRIGWIDYSSPPPPEMASFHTWLRQLPTSGDEFIEFNGVNENGDVTSLRLAAIPDESNDKTKVSRISVTNSVAGKSDNWVLPIDRQAFAEDLDVEEVIVWPETGDSPGKNNAITFFRGLPEPCRYDPKRIRYLDSPLRDEKFQCCHAYSRVLYEPTGRDAPVIVRRDLWLTDDVPFGVLMFETTVSDAQTGAILSRQRMKAVRASSVRPFDKDRLGLPSILKPE